MRRRRDAWRRDWRAFADCREGAAILEFALVLPILLVVAGAVFELGRAIVMRAALEGAVRAGARYLAQAPDPACRPGCSPGAAHALALARRQAEESTGLPADRISITIDRDPPAGTVIVVATTDLQPALFAVPGWRPSWAIHASHQEARVAD